jgi:propanol-preferring alcohol dehydrogenase
MKAMILNGTSRLQDEPAPLQLVDDLPEPVPGVGELLLDVSVCGICHTDIDEIEGRTPPSRLPMILGHQIVGSVRRTGSDAHRFDVGDRVGVAWIHSACGRCQFCREGKENLCPEFAATGRDAPGGYCQQTVVPQEFAHRIPDVFSDAEAAPLLCAGAVGYRALRLTGMEDGRALGLVGFGASAHLVIQAARQKYPDAKLFVFSRSEGERDFARELGADWAGAIDEEPPQPLDCAIDTTPAWSPIVTTLAKLAPGGRLVINAIRKEDADKDALLALDYSRHLWLEKEVISVANVTRQDVSEFLRLAAEIPLKPRVQEFALERANEALQEIRQRRIRGGKVLRIGS